MKMLIASDFELMWDRIIEAIIADEVLTFLTTNLTAVDRVPEIGHRELVSHILVKNLPPFGDIFGDEDL